MVQWTLEIAGRSVLPTLVDFLGEVAQRRTDPALVAGLEAQMPTSPLVIWLHRDGSPIAGDPRVVAGDMEGAARRGRARRPRRPSRSARSSR